MMQIISQIRTITVLIKTKTLLLLNTLRAKQGFYNLLLIILFGIGWCVFAAHQTTSATKVLGVFLGPEAMRGPLAIAISYLVLLVFITDILMGHTLNIGQMSTDIGFLSTLPVSSESLLILKLYERVITDWIGFIFLFSGFLGLSWHGTPTLSWFAISVLLYLEVSLISGLAITLVGIVLQRVARPSTIENLFSLLGYFCAFAGLLPILFVASAPMKWAMKMVTWSKSTGVWYNVICAPAYWLVDSLLTGFSSPSFYKFQLFCLFVLAAGGAVFHIMARWNWPGWVHAGRRLNAKSSHHLLSGLLRKEALLLRSDWNILTNSLLMPISIIIMEIWVLHDIVSLDTSTTIMNMLAAAVMYFSMFGPLNAVGSEGKAISLLETLPISPTRIIGIKTLFWSITAGCCFIPASIATSYYCGLSMASIFAVTFWTSVITPAMIWVAISLSAIYARYDGRVLQQRTYMTAKLVAPFVMGLAVPIKAFDFSSLLYAAMFFAFAIALHYKATKAIALRLDPESLRPACFDALDAFIMLIVLFGINRLMTTLIVYADLSESVRAWPWFVTSMFVMFILPGICWNYASLRFPDPGKVLGLRKPSSYSCFASAILAAIALSLFTLPYCNFVKASGLPIFSAGSELWEIACRFFDHTWAVFLTFFIMCLALPVTEELFFRSFCLQAFITTGWTPIGSLLASALCSAIFLPPLWIVPAFFAGLAAACLFKKTRSLWPSIIFHALYNVFIIYIHAANL